MNNNYFYFLGYTFEDSKLEDGKLVIRKNSSCHLFFKKIIAKLMLNNTRVDDIWTFDDCDARTKAVTKFFSDYGAFDKKKMIVIPEEHVWAFIAGYFDAYGTFTVNGDSARLAVHSSRPDIIDFLSKHWKTRTHHVDRIYVFGYKALDICGKMYASSDFRNQRYELFWDTLNWTPKEGWYKKEVFYYMKLDPKAIPPSKDRVTDTGFDLYAVEMKKCYGNVYEFDTKLAVKPAPGFYFDLVGRSSLPKKGWQFLQGVGIIDKSFQGSIMMHLMKLDDREIPKLPFKCAQLVVRRVWHVDWESSNNLGDSDRGAQGFGSSDK
jgi:dUTPase